MAEADTRERRHQIPTEFPAKKSGHRVDMDNVDVDDKKQPVEHPDAIHHDEVDASPKEFSRVRWKIDLVVLPCITIAMLLAFLDKNALSYAAIWGIRADNGLKGQDYSWVASGRSI